MRLWFGWDIDTFTYGLHWRWGWDAFPGEGNSHWRHRGRIEFMRGDEYYDIGLWALSPVTFHCCWRTPREGDRASSTWTGRDRELTMIIIRALGRQWRVRVP